MYRMMTTKRFIISYMPTNSRVKQIVSYLMPLWFIAAYFLLQLWILPMFGVQT